MRHRVAGKKLGRPTAHRKAMLRNLLTSLILNDRIETTLARAKELRKLADWMITLAKQNTIHSRRQAAMYVYNKTALQKLFTTLVDRYRERTGGYTRIVKLGYRHGDAAEMAIIEYLTAEMKQEASAPKGKGKDKVEKATGEGRKEGKKDKKEKKEEKEKKEKKSGKKKT